MKQVGRLSIKRLIISPYPPLARSFLIFKSTAREMETFPVQDVTSPLLDNFGGMIGVSQGTDEFDRGSFSSINRSVV